MCSTWLSSAYARTVEPKATFENPEDYTHIFCIEEGQAWKLMSALYDAKVSLARLGSVQ